MIEEAVITRSEDQPLADALRRFLVTNSCPVYLRTAATNWLEATK